MCALGPMDPGELLEPKITVTWVAMYMYVKSVATESPFRHGEFLPKRTTSSHRLGPIEDLAWTPSPNLYIRHVSLVPIDP